MHAARVLEGGSGDYVALADVRAALHPNLDRAAVDAALQRLAADPAVVIAPDDDQAAMTQAQRDAAIRIGGQANHLITFQPDG